MLMRKFRIPFLTGLTLLAIVAVLWAAGSTDTVTRVSKWGISESNLSGVAVSGTSTIDDTIIGGTTPAAGTFTGMTGTSLTLNGVSLTSTLAELNKLDGVTSDSSELNFLDGSAAGTAVANKAAVLGANKNLDEFHTATLYLGATAGTQVTSSAAELNKLDGVTSDSNEFNILDGVTASAAEINILDNVTADSNEINLLDGSIAGTAVASKAATLGTNKNLDEFHTAALYLGADAGTQVTSSADELNILDGVTASAAELNILDNVTADSNEINVLDGATAGTAVASKAVVLDGSKKISGLVLSGHTVEIVDSDTDLTILATHSGKIITNYGATVSETFTLPTAAAGLVIDILHTDTDNLKVVKSGSDTILGTSTDSLVIATGTLGGSLRLVATRALQWVITGREDTWTDTTVLP